MFVILNGFQCNNPQTKEPKLESAIRIIGEWREYDNEIKSLIKEHEQELPLMANFETAEKTIQDSARQEQETASSREQHEHEDL